MELQKATPVEEIMRLLGMPMPMVAAIATPTEREMEDCTRRFLSESMR
jgi:hypothetical protein